MVEVIIVPVLYKSQIGLGNMVLQTDTVRCVLPEAKFHVLVPSRQDQVGI